MISSGGIVPGFDYFELKIVSIAMSATVKTYLN